MAEAVSLEFIAGQLHLVLDEQRATRADLRRLSDNQAGLLKLIDRLSERLHQQKDDLILSIKIEMGGLFGNLRPG
jgi:hypothetical protein